MKYLQYLLINKSTGQQTLCDKVSIDGFDCYVCDDVGYPNDAVHSNVTNTIVRFTDPRHFSEGTYKKVIATTNPNIDIPKVVNEVEVLAFEIYKIPFPDKFSNLNQEAWKERYAFIEGYNKSQETHPFSEEDMVEFYEWCETSDEAARFWRKYRVYPDMSGSHHKIVKERRKQLLQLWKAQQPTKVYYQ